MRTTRLVALPTSLSPGVDYLNVALGRIGKDYAIGGEERGTPSTGSGDDQTIGRIGMEATGKSCAIDRYPRLDG